MSHYLVTETRWWWHTPLIPVLGRWRQKGIWLGREKNVRQEETGTQMQSKDAV